ncbi:MAG: hypothetical protein QW625_01845 [Candidatus Nanoarchaeia archaeon]
MKIKNKVCTISLLVIALLLIGILFLNFELGKNKSLLSEKEIKITDLESKIKNQEVILKDLEKDKNLKLITWSELKAFLELDDTNKLIYDNKTFDCTGFAIELFKRARNAGIKAGFVEIEYENEKAGHSLNVFETTDKGLIFVDVVGDEEGTGWDKIAFVKPGKKYFAIALQDKETFLDCSLDCTELPYKEFSEIKYEPYSEKFLENVLLCYELFNNCIEKYNAEVEKYNRKKGAYSYEELKMWRNNLRKLKEELTINNKSIIIEGEILKNIQIYF